MYNSNRLSGHIQFNQLTPNFEYNMLIISGTRLYYRFEKSEGYNVISKIPDYIRCIINNSNN